MTGLPRSWASQPWLGPEVLVAALILLLCSSTAITRNFGLFLIGFLALPELLLVLLACIGSSVAHRRGGRSVPLALIILAVSWPLSFRIQTVDDAVVEPVEKATVSRQVDEQHGYLELIAARRISKLAQPRGISGKLADLRRELRAELLSFLHIGVVEATGTPIEELHYAARLTPPNRGRP